MDKGYDSKQPTAPASCSLPQSGSPPFLALPTSYQLINSTGLSLPQHTFTHYPPVLHAPQQPLHSQHFNSHQPHEKTLPSAAYQQDTPSEHQLDNHPPSLASSFTTHTTASKPRSYRASRACESCRAHKTKCDEQKPSCKNCSDKYLKCEYRDAPLTAIEKAKKDILDAIKGTPWPVEEELTATISELLSEIRELQGKMDRMQVSPKSEDIVKEAPGAVTPFNPVRLPLLAISTGLTPKETTVSSTSTCQEEKSKKRAASPDCRYVKRVNLESEEDFKTDIACLGSKLDSVAADVQNIKKAMKELGDQIGRLKEYLE
ncbi:hypothetical protein F5883DRAFT_578446 [Diaporthe sp. PMI_573]|nr:hypothetical protein F5883DRAFT_578446 [Diaporthaceae sp. PMI_573]